MFNNANKEYSVKKGDKVGQIVFQKWTAANFKLSNFLTPTERGGNGFGSTGNNVNEKNEKKN